MISVCILAHNEENCIDRAIRSVIDLKPEIILADDSSTDKTVEVARREARDLLTVHKLSKRVSELGFANAVNEMISKATREWILILDADEECAEGFKMLPPLTRYVDKHVWSLPRRKWDASRAREEYEAYPDWQPKFFRNHRGVNYIGEMHIRINTPDRIYYTYRGPHIDHYQASFRTKEKIIQRTELYKALATRQGVAIDGGHVLVK